MTKTTVSFDSLNVRKASETPFSFPFIGADGAETGVILKVLGAQSETAAKATRALMDEQRRKDAVREAEAGSRVADRVKPFEEDIEFGLRLAALRLVGWEGLDVEWSPEKALELCRINADVAAQVNAQANKVSNFTKASPKA